MTKGIYYCENCGNYYQKGEVPVNCGVLHSLGDCCHYGDKLITKEKMNKIKEITNE